MSAIHVRAPLAVACACLSVSHAIGQTPAAGTGPWTKVPALPTVCYQNVDANTADPFYAKLEAAKAAVAADRDRQAALNAQIEKDFNDIDPMEKARRMQQWMMTNPQQAMAFAQAAQGAPAAAQADIATLQQQTKAPQEAWNAVRNGYDDARIAAYAPIEARRKALAASIGYAYSSERKDLVNPNTNFFQDSSTPAAAWGEGEKIKKAYDQAYQALCPQWWGANGKVQAFMKQQKAWFISDRIPFLTKGDGLLLQQYAMMSTPAATWRSMAEFKAVEEYLDLAWKVYSDRDSQARCSTPRDCDGAYP